VLNPSRLVEAFGSPVEMVTFAVPMLGLLAKAEICKALSAVVHETVRRICASIRLPAAAVRDAPYRATPRATAAARPSVLIGTEASAHPQVLQRAFRFG
jgi:hypothetical protein